SVAAAGALLREPGVEAGRDEAVGALLPLGGGRGEVVGVVVLGVVVVAPDPPPFHLVGRQHLIQLLPQLEVFEGTALAAPPLALPRRHPLRDTLHQVLRIRDVAHPRVLPLAADPLERRDRPGDGHLVVRRLRRALVEVPARDAVTRRRLQQRAVAAGAGFRGIVPETTLVRVHQHRDPALRRHGWITTGMSVWRRISSACETTMLGRSPPCGTWAPANRASQRVRRTTVAPRLSALRVAPRRPTSAASTSFANSASTSAASPSRSTTSTLSRAAATRSRARPSIAPSTPPPASWTCTTSSAASKRWPSTT